RVELALDQADHAVDLVDRDLEAGGEPAARRGHERSPRALEPAGRGRAVDPEGGADLVDRELIDDLLAQQRAVLRAELGDRLAQRGRELGAVLGLELRQQRIAGVTERLVERPRARRLAGALALVPDQLAG